MQGDQRVHLLHIVGAHCAELFEDPVVNAILTDERTGMGSCRGSPNGGAAHLLKSNQLPLFERLMACFHEEAAALRQALDIAADELDLVPPHEVAQYFGKIDIGLIAGTDEIVAAHGMLQHHLKDNCSQAAALSNIGKRLRIIEIFGLIMKHEAGSAAVVEIDYAETIGPENAHARVPGQPADLLLENTPVLTHFGKS